MRISDWSSDVCSSDLALTRQVAERPVHHPLARDAILPREARPLDRQAELRFAAAVVAGMAVMLRTVVAQCAIRIGKSGGKQPFPPALPWTFFVLPPIFGVSDERRVGHEFVRSCRSRWCP